MLDKKISSTIAHTDIDGSVYIGVRSLYQNNYLIFSKDDLYQMLGMIDSEESYISKEKNERCADVC